MTVSGQTPADYPLYDDANRLKRIEQGSSVVFVQTTRGSR
jgi:hypothetical protein